MAIDSNFDVPASESVDFDTEETLPDLNNDIAEFELNSGSNEGVNNKVKNKRSFLTKKRIEQLQEERRLKKFDDDYYDDWD
ncbi:MAG: PA3496 family putative envelope integrity protein [Colwellia sp.]